jgi:hypothetical protein
MADEPMLHGSEDFFVEGEGLLTTQVGGRDRDETDPVNESESPRPAAAKQLATDAAPKFRFSRVGPKGTPLSAAITKKLAQAMVVGGGGEGDVPAGYTYLGQFIDHDLTMDKTKVMLGTEVSPADLLQGRSPRLDLDSLYGVGPASAGSAKFYAADGMHLRVGNTIDDGPGAKTGHDLPRAGTGATEKARRKAVIPDPRNDENLIVAQTHVAMIRFHNRAVDKTSTALTPHQRFVEARKNVTLHYQWLIRHDYLPRIVQPSVLDNVFAHGRKLVEPAADPMSVPTMPLEFSVAAFRLGHSMVRKVYNWNSFFPNEDGLLQYMFDFSGLGGPLGGNRRLVSTWLADWRRMYDFPHATKPRTGLKAPGIGVNHAMRIDTRLTHPLAELPPSTFGGAASMPSSDLRRNLAFRNLTRSRMVHLASGQQMVAKLKNVGVNVTPLTRAQIVSGNGGAKLDNLTSAEKDKVVAATPLWFYVLREAEINGGRLRGVGARIVAETFHRAIQGSRFSIVRDTAFKPTFGPNASTFEMTDLLFFAFEGKKAEIAPVG